MNSELSIRDFHCFETDLNRIKDLTGTTLLIISAWSSNGMLSDIFGGRILILGFGRKN
ncbi:hypothetical protein Hanom_Chr13g01244631 [Helianthus anomalus]